MSPSAFPDWLKDGSLLICLFVAGQVLTELIKKAINGKNGNGNGNGKHNLVPGSYVLFERDTVDRIIRAFEDHIKAQQDMVNELRGHKQIELEQKALLQAHVEDSREPMRQITDIHRKIIHGH